MIKEDLLHYMWRSHRIPKIGMQTTEGEFIEILSPGIHNHGDGPDFSHAKIRISDVLWAGPVEIHIQASDWYAHKHQIDRRYDNVILHVVFEENAPVFIEGRRIPCIELKNLIKPELIKNYIHLKSSRELLACSAYETPDITENFLWMRDKLLTERLKRRIYEIQSPNNSSLQIFYLMVFGAFGAKANKESFVDLCTRINWAQLARWRMRPERIYSYLMQLSGLFKPSEIPKTEFITLKAYINNHEMKVTSWITRGIRPPNQPKKRILEICALIKNEVFTPLIEADSAYEFNQNWIIIFHQLRNRQVENIKFSDFLLKNLVINALAPFAFHRGVQSGDADWFDFALFLLDDWPPEKNNIVKLYTDKSLKIKTSGDSQALLELNRQYCTPKKCVSCAIGTSLLRA